MTRIEYFGGPRDGEHFPLPDGGVEWGSVVERHRSGIYLLVMGEWNGNGARGGAIRGGAIRAQWWQGSGDWDCRNAP